MDAVNQFLVTVEGIDGYFMTLEGGNITSQSNKMYDGGATIPSVVTNRPLVDDITVTRGYEPLRDEDIMTELRQLVGVFTTTLSKAPTDRNLVVIGRPIVYPNAVLTGFNERNADANGTDASVWGLVFTVPSVR